MIPAARLRATKQRAIRVVDVEATEQSVTAAYNANVPAAAAAGDLLLMYLLKSGNTGAFPTPTGWTQLWNDTYGSSKVACFAKVSEGETSVAVTGVSSALNVAHIVAVRGASTVDVFSRSSSTSNSTTLATPSVTTTAVGDLVVRQAYFFNSGGSAVISWPAGQTIVEDYPSSSGTSRWSYAAAVYPAAGATGTVTATGSSGPRLWSTVALKP